MSEPQSVSMNGLPAAHGVRASIARAAEATGVDFSYLLAQARLESGLDPSARAPTSSAAGLYQFTRGTWLETLDRHGAEHGLGWADAAIAGGRVSDPGLRAQVMALRFDPDASARMAAELARDNAGELSRVLGRAPDPAELYLAHFLGSGGAATFLSALAADPGQSAAALLPQAASANRSIFYDKGAPRSVGGVMELMRGKVAAAMAADGGALPQGQWADVLEPDSPAAQGWSGGWPSARPSAPMNGTGQGNGITPRPSMAATLATTFGLASSEGRAAAPASVQAAYDRLRRFDL